MRSLLECAEWVLSLSPGTLPAEARIRVQQQHVSAAQLVQHRDPIALACAPYVGNAQALAKLAGIWGNAPAYDLSLAGHPTLGSVIGTWSTAESGDAEDMWAATAAAQELVARLAICTAMQSRPGLCRTWLCAAEIVIARCYMQRRSPQELATALGHVLTHNSTLRLPASELWKPASRAHAWSQAAHCAWEALDNPTPPPDDLLKTLADAEPRALTLLPRAFSHLGQRSLCALSTLAKQDFAPWITGPVQALEHLLHEVSLAAKRPFNDDLIERIEVFVDHLSWRQAQDCAPDRRGDLHSQLPWSIPLALGVTGCLPLARREPLALEHNRLEVLHWSRKVTVQPDWSLTAKWAEDVSRCWSFLLEVTSPSERMNLLSRALARIPPPRWPQPHAALEMMQPTARAVAHVLNSSVRLKRPRRPVFVRVTSRLGTFEVSDATLSKPDFPPPATERFPYDAELSALGVLEQLSEPG